MAYRLTVSDRAVREIGEAYEWYEEQLHGLGPNSSTLSTLSFNSLRKRLCCFPKFDEAFAVPFSRIFPTAYSMRRKAMSFQSWR